MKRFLAIFYFLTLCFHLAYAQEDVKDKERRNFINEFLTYYKEAYEKEDIGFIESFFSSNALIITETKQLSRCGAELIPNTTKKRPYKSIVEDKKNI